MKLNFHINGKNLTADFTTKDGQVYLSGEELNCEGQLYELQPNVFTVVINGKVYACALEKRTAGSTEVIINGQRLVVNIQDPKRLRHNGSAGALAGGRAILTSPMPGKVVRVLCAQGDVVTEGQGLVIVEAMKMQNEVQSPKAGKVTEIQVAVGQTVNAGETLAVVE